MINTYQYHPFDAEIIHENSIFFPPELLAKGYSFFDFIIDSLNEAKIKNNGEISRIYLNEYQWRLIYEKYNTLTPDKIMIGFKGRQLTIEVISVSIGFEDYQICIN